MAEFKPYRLLRRRQRHMSFLFVRWIEAKRHAMNESLNRNKPPEDVKIRRVNWFYFKSRKTHSCLLAHKSTSDNTASSVVIVGANIEETEPFLLLT